MSSFDTVRLQCVWCEQTTLVQSKGGDCDLATYEAVAVPIAVAGGIVGCAYTCDHCERTFVVQTNTFTVALRTIVPQEDASHPDYDPDFDIHAWKRKQDRKAESDRFWWEQSMANRARANAAIKLRACHGCHAPKGQPCKTDGPTKRGEEWAHVHVSRIHSIDEEMTVADWGGLAKVTAHHITEAIASTECPACHAGHRTPCMTGHERDTHGVRVEAYLKRETEEVARPRRG